MEKKKPGKKSDRKEEKEQEFSGDLFDNKNSTIDEADSDGSGSAFEETERVNEDNFDDLSEK